MVMQAHARLYIFLWAVLYCLKLHSCSVIISGKKLLDNTAQGITSRQNIEKFEQQVISQIETERQAVASREQEVAQMRKYIDAQIQEISQNSKKEQQDQRKQLQNQEENLSLAVQNLAEQQATFMDHVEQAQQVIKNKYDQVTDIFYKSTLDRWASFFHWDIVFPANSQVVLYARDRFDVTEKMLHVMNAESATHGKTYASKSETLKLFSSLGIVYLEVNKTDGIDTKNLDARNSYWYLENKAKLDHYLQQYGADIATHKTAPFCIKWISDKVGFGLFATVDIKVQDLIQEYTGVLRVQNPKYDDLTYAWTYPSLDKNSKQLCVDSKYEGNAIRFVNHSNHPNCVEITLMGHDNRFHICYIAKYDIKAGEQILVSYGKDYWNGRPYYEELN